jgi:hypothetical protein
MSLRIHFGLSMFVAANEASFIDLQQQRGRAPDYPPSFLPQSIPRRMSKVSDI